MSILNKALSRISVNLLNIAKYSVNVSHTTDTLAFKSNFTSEEQQKVLKILNGLNPEQLASLSISQARIQNLQKWKTRKGSFRSLNEVLEVEGLGEKVLEQLCERIISDDTAPIKFEANGNNKRLKQLISPPLPASVLNRIESVVAIHLSPIGASWAKLSKIQNCLCSWSCESFTEVPKKILPTDSFQVANRILRKLPPADIYILEANPSSSPQAKGKISVTVAYNQQIELTSMLIALLNTSEQHNPAINPKSSKIENKVYLLRARIPARLFRTLVGTEQVSALAKIMELVQYDGTSNFSLPCTPIDLTDQLRNSFLSQTPVNKELMGHALMLAVSFMDLCLYKNPISLVAITPGKNNGKK